MRGRPICPRGSFSFVFPFPSDVPDLSCGDTKKIASLQCHTAFSSNDTAPRSRHQSSISLSIFITCLQDHESLLKKELYRLSNKAECKETGVVNAKDVLRSTQAKLAIQQGKRTIARIEAQLDAAQITLHLIHTICIIWPNSAAEVLLVGSFDGWTYQRRMEQSKAGIFTLHLKLYPGLCEIKFIVHGVWMVDLLMPTVWNNGNENNLFLVP